MKKRTLVCSLTALSFGLAVAPSMAGTVYVPIPKAADGDGSTQAVEIWVSNTGATQRPFTTTFLKADSDGTNRDGTTPPTNRIPGGRLFFISNAGSNGEAGLLEVDATPELHVEARLKSVAPGGALAFSSVPIITSDNLFQGGGTATLLGLSRDGASGHTDLAVVNLGQQATQCQVKLFRSNATQIGGTSVVTLKPLSTRLFDDALGLVGEQQAADVRAQVSCEAPFYAFATLFNPQHSQLTFVTPAVNGTSALTVPGKPGGGDPADPGALLYELPGLIHEPTQGNEARDFTIPLAEEVVLKKLVVDLDFVPGPWNTSKVPGNHALVWIYRGKYRSGTIVNVNAFGPGKFVIKMNQNVDLPPGHVTAKEAPLTLEQGQLYHLRYEYNAEINKITFEVSRNGAVLAAATMDGTAKNGRLRIPPTSDSELKVHFGHMRGQEGPEIPSYRWKYSNLRVQLVPY